MLVEREYKTDEKTRARAKRYYDANRAKVIARVQGYREESRAIIAAAKAVSCADCGGECPQRDR